MREMSLITRGRSGITLLAAALVAVVLTASGCASGDSGAATRSTQGEPGVAASPTTSSQAGELGTASLPPDPVASKTPHVSRPKSSGSESAAPKASAQPKSFDGTVSYDDGVTLRIRKIEHSDSQARGRGSFHGAPLATFTLDLTNDSAKPLDVSTAVVTLVYGDPSRTASPTYERGARDFAGTVLRGSTATGVYAFRVGASDLARAKMYVDIDAAHDQAVFTGKA